MNFPMPHARIVEEAVQRGTQKLIEKSQAKMKMDTHYIEEEEILETRLSSTSTVGHVRLLMQM